MVIIAIVAFLNTVLRITEKPIEQWYHEPGLYAIAKGFNVFFGVTVLVAIICIAYQIGDRILHIASLRERADYNLYLFLGSATAVVAIPGLYMVIVHLRLFSLGPHWNSLPLLTLSTCLALHASIFFLLAIFLLLTSVLTTLRSYNVFKYLVKLRQLHRTPPPPKKSAMRQSAAAKKQPNTVPRQQQALPSVIGRVPQRYRKRLQQQQRILFQQQQLLQPGTPVSRHQRVVQPWIMQQQRTAKGRTPSIPSTSWQSFTGSSGNTSPRIVILSTAHPHIRRPATPSQRSLASVQPFMV